MGSLKHFNCKRTACQSNAVSAKRQGRSTKRQFDGETRRLLGTYRRYGDPNVALDEVGVPRSIATTLTYPERGNRNFLLLRNRDSYILLAVPHNLSYLSELVRNGPREYPGVRYIIRDTGERMDLRYNKRADAFPQIGWIVEWSDI